MDSIAAISHTGVTSVIFFGLLSPPLEESNLVPAPVSHPSKGFAGISPQSATWLRYKCSSPMFLSYWL